MANFNSATSTIYSGLYVSSTTATSTFANGIKLNNGGIQFPDNTTQTSAMRTIRKTSDETVNNSTTLTNDNELFLAMAANETWFFKVLFMHIGNITADINVAFTIPTGATLVWGCSGTRQLSDGNIGGCGAITTSGGAQSYAAFTTVETVVLTGVVVNGGTAGNLQFQWAQNTATAVDTKVVTDSYLEAHK
ncbi:MAG: hypothetical protein HYZ69_02750 [Candidatus Colwellbacteria bacterium]|nr:hypothetical protein [Candidatus Colwellbacteria bacterium]